MLARAITAFVALPGMVAFAVPITMGISAGRPLRHIGLGLVPLGLGTLLLLWCVREFYVARRGTLAPWAPPERLVTSGPYRFSRNPMYIAVVTILVGWCTLWASRTLIIYTAVVLCAVYLRVRLAEEPWAARRFGAQWEAYRGCVPRWLI
jgi:protein-S-isoprenylcysteine O-methyltransferase Ste14